MTPPEDQEGAEATRARRGGPLAVLCLSAFGLGLSPIMPGTVASLATAALLLWAPPGLIGFILMAVVCLIVGSFVLHAQVRLEETRLAEVHGDAYARYRDRVPR